MQMEMVLRNGWMLQWLGKIKHDVSTIQESQAEGTMRGEEISFLYIHSYPLIHPLTSFRTSCHNIVYIYLLILQFLACLSHTFLSILHTTSSPHTFSSTVSPYSPYSLFPPLEPSLVARKKVEIDAEVDLMKQFVDEKTVG